MRAAADVAMRQIGELENRWYAIPEKTPYMTIRGTGMPLAEDHVQQFGRGSMFTEWGCEKV